MKDLLKTHIKTIVVMVMLGLWLFLVWGWLILMIVFSLPMGCVRAVAEVFRGQ
jgi:hypothetical protein